jgi:hypothetical protein
MSTSFKSSGILVTSRALCSSTSSSLHQFYKRLTAILLSMGCQSGGRGGLQLMHCASSTLEG